MSGSIFSLKYLYFFLCLSFFLISFPPQSSASNDLSLQGIPAVRGMTTGTKLKTLGLVKGEMELKSLTSDKMVLYEDIHLSGVAQTFLGLISGKDIPTDVLLNYTVYKKYNGKLWHILTYRKSGSMIITGPVELYETKRTKNQQIIVLKSKRFKMDILLTQKPENKVHGSASFTFGFVKLPLSINFVTTN